MDEFKENALYGLLRMALDLECNPSFFLYSLTPLEWDSLHEECLRQLIAAVCYRAVNRLPRDKQPPLDLALQWACETETVKGQNKLLNEEASRLTRLFAAWGKKTAVLKGPANARLYPDLFMRHVGDIDLWVDGGRDSVLALLRDMGCKTVDSDLLTCQHHIGLCPGENGISVEIHYRPSSGSVNLFRNVLLQRFLENEIKNTEFVPEGFYVPSIKFALVMQLAHVQRHFVMEGIGFKQLVDYYVLLQHASEDDLREVASLVPRFGLLPSCGAVMWIFDRVFGLPHDKMLAKPDERRGKMMLAGIYDGGNFGLNKQNETGKSSHFAVRWLKRRWRSVQMFYFAPIDALGREWEYWVTFLKFIPVRVKLRRFSLSDLE